MTAGFFACYFNICISLFSNADNRYDVVLQAAANGQLSNQLVQVTIRNIDEGTPVFTSADIQTIDENSLAVTTLTATDSDGDDDAISYSLTGKGPDASAFRLTGDALAFIRAPDFEAPTDSDGNNVYEVTVSAASNGKVTE